METDDHSSVEWTAGWPRPLAYRIRFGAVLLIVGGFVLMWVSPGAPPTLGALSIGLLVGAALSYLDSTRTYRATPTGLERRTKLIGWTARRRLAWETFAGFSVTDDAIVLHRPFPHLDVRCARGDVIQKEPAILETLEAYLDRRT